MYCRKVMKGNVIVVVLWLKECKVSICIESHSKHSTESFHIPVKEAAYLHPAADGLLRHAASTGTEINAFSEDFYSQLKLHVAWFPTVTMVLWFKFHINLHPDCFWNILSCFRSEEYQYTKIETIQRKWTLSILTHQHFNMSFKSRFSAVQVMICPK